MQLLTIGHSNHQIEKFIDLLKDHNITAIADVRSAPYSRYHPQYNKKELKNELNQNNIQYSFLGKELGARTDNLDCYVDNKAVYEKIAQTPNFSAGLQRIRKGLTKYKIALMCAEKDPITCHRAILVCRNLRKEINIEHILFDGQLESHQHLEDRLLELYQLKGKRQLSLFDNKDNQLKSHQELIEEAYELQGKKIAYIKDK